VRDAKTARRPVHEPMPGRGLPRYQAQCY